MKDQKEIEERLSNELAESHQRIADLEVQQNKDKQVEEALRDSESLYRSLFDHIPVGLYRTTPTGQILDANPALVQRELPGRRARPSSTISAGRPKRCWP